MSKGPGFSAGPTRDVQEGSRLITKGVTVRNHCHVRKIANCVKQCRQASVGKVCLRV